MFVERLWRSVKYEEVYLHAYESVAAARGRYFRFYNAERRHQGLGRRTPDAVHADSDLARGSVKQGNHRVRRTASTCPLLPGVVDMETVLKGVCGKCNLIDLVENFIVFDDTSAACWTGTRCAPISRGIARKSSSGTTARRIE